MNKDEPMAVPEQCLNCARLETRQGYVVLPAQDFCGAADGSGGGPAAEVLSHLLLVAARLETCRLKTPLEEYPDAYRSHDAAPPLGHERAATGNEDRS